MSTERFARTPAAPYYAVIFTSQRTDVAQGYDDMAQRMVQLAERQPGFLGAESARDASGFGMTISYWDSLASITNWKAHPEHLVAQAAGRADWYARYALRVCKVERADTFIA